ncbi:DUF4268 domain-containing protein [Diaphorobacter nitroreducens]|uniref:DUF4268 domain-containing protein n=1 Tax=Diaphorobacter nitroreducens TaxID=164759 RepID=UPI0028984E63|nr:DUF4268 domain-containing protein [Diaphorobacter nitroreducens]
MPLYAITDAELRPVAPTTFASQAILERKHLQAMLMRDSSSLGEGLMVLCEEYTNWQDSSRRIDLLCLSRDRGLVVVEIKRTEDGGHMELQAVRYAAMVSSMTLDQAIDAHARALGGDDARDKARAAVLEHLDLESDDEDELTGSVGIILVSADFSTELTTSVMWLKEQGLDIRCVRFQPYLHQSQVLVDVAQIIPLPEAADYLVKIREQQDEKRKVETKRQEIFRRFWGQFVALSKQTSDLYAGRSPTTDHWLSAGIGKAGAQITCSLTEDLSRVEIWINLGKDKAATNKEWFDVLYKQKDEIEKDFGNTLQWQRLDDRIGCRICIEFDGGWRSPESAWPAMQKRLIDNADRLGTAFGPRLRLLKAG